MERKIVLAVAYAIAIVFLVHRQVVHVSTLTEPIKIEGGTVVGVVEGDMRVFRGLPFAAPPIGSLRWKEPQPVQPWSGTRQSDAFAPVCVQTRSTPDSVYYMSIDKMSEDCLYLNVWTGAVASAKQPVMVYIHGGGLTRGAGSNPRHNGSGLARNGVVVVTINYRLGPLGYFAHPQLTAESSHHASGNYGTLDQIAALKWVQKNIAAFGGDPTQVTVFGQSAGSWSVNTLVASPLSKGLFKRAIGMSGARFHRGTYVNEQRNLADAERRGTDLASAVGATSLAELRATSAEKLMAVPGFRAVENVDGWVLPLDIRQIYDARKQNSVAVMIGSTADEMTTITPESALPKTLEAYRKWVATQYGPYAKDFDEAYPVASPADIAKAVLGSQRDMQWTLEMRSWARATVAAGARAYLYQWTYPVPNPRKGLGAYHASEVEYVFDDLWIPEWTYSDVDRRVATTMARYWSNFAKTGDPNSDGLPKWEPYDRSTEPYMDLGVAPQLRYHLAKMQLDFLERFADGSRATSQQQFK